MQRISNGAFFLLLLHGALFVFLYFYYGREEFFIIFERYDTYLLTSLSLVTIIFFVFLMLDTRLLYLRRKHFLEKDITLFEILSPANLLQSPKKMANVIEGFSSKSLEGNWLDRYWRGNIRAIYSFELCSFEGHVRMFIRCPTFFRTIVKSSFYSQYPQVELREVPDYMDEVPYNSEEDKLFGCDFTQAKKEVYPLYTTDDILAERKRGEVPESVVIQPSDALADDPLAQVVEAYTAIGTGEFIFTQIVFRVHTGYERIVGLWKHFNIIEQAKEVIEKEIGYNEESKRDNIKEADYNVDTLVQSIRKKLARGLYDTGIRTLYIARPEYATPRHSQFIGTLKIFSRKGYNALIPHGGHIPFAYPWFPLKEFLHLSKRGTLQKQTAIDMYRNYRRRDFFVPLAKTAVGEAKLSVLSAEELATLFHPLGLAVPTINVARLDSRKVSAPANIPRV